MALVLSLQKSKKKCKSRIERTNNELMSWNKTSSGRVVTLSLCLGLSGPSLNVSPSFVKDYNVSEG